MPSLLTRVLSCVGLAPSCSRPDRVVARERMEPPCPSRKLCSASGMGRVDMIEYTDGCARPFDRKRDTARVRSFQFKPMPVCMYTPSGRIWLLGGNYRVDLRTRSIVNLSGGNRARKMSLRQARRLPGMDEVERDFREKHWENGPKEALGTHVEDPPRILYALGYLTAITYWAKKDEEGNVRWRHPFGEEPLRLGAKELVKLGFQRWRRAFGEPPVLAAVHGGRQIYLVSGTYSVREEGIIDTPGRAA
jgi:hypothetical protein